MFLKRILLVVIPVLLLLSCAGQPKSPESLLYAEIINLKYAEGFVVQNMDNFRRVVVNNPWQTDLPMAVYYLVTHDSVLTPDDGMKIRVPVSSIAVSSVTQVGFLDALKAVDFVRGSCSPELVYQPDIQQKNINGQLTHLGDAFTINVERTMLLNPSVVMMSGYKQDDPYAERVRKVGIPVVYVNEWMEETVLGRAEWLKFVALLLGKEMKADSIFEIVEKQYLTLKDSVSRAESRPSVLTGSNFRGTWYMPGGKNYMAHMLQDAGAFYYYASDKAKGSLPLNVESVLKNFSNADVWLNANFSSLKEMLEADAKHALFGAVDSGRVYNFNKRLLPSGANDFWESAVVRPDWLLNDLVHILHPELFPDHELMYYQQLLE
jgi:iron complex transport system substrate-binding protein